ncbi:MAG: RNA methyltransferase [Alphaproteobacteria bacterium]|nr:RNA methyltransferase [Alphaproteobacteria bacterium]
MKNIKNIIQPSAPVVILARPQLDENMGMVARAMMNCCLSELRLVNPRDNHLSAKAISASSGSQQILESAKCFSSLEEALQDIHFVLATSARKRDMTKEIYAPQDGIQLLHQKIGNGAKTALLFGAERTGLENKEIVYANGIVEIPLNPLHASLNLSQAVLLMGYEWHKSTLQQTNTHLESGGCPLATHTELSAFFDHIETELEKRGYFRFIDKKERMSHNLRNIFSRNNLTSSEIKTLHKIVTDLTRKPNEK